MLLPCIKYETLSFILLKKLIIKTLTNMCLCNSKLNKKKKLKKGY
jgi:hypothetical protein